MPQTCSRSELSLDPWTDSAQWSTIWQIFDKLSGTFWLINFENEVISAFYTPQNMPESGFFLTRIFPYKDGIYDYDIYDSLLLR